MLSSYHHNSTVLGFVFFCDNTKLRRQRAYAMAFKTGRVDLILVDELVDDGKRA